MQEETPTAQEFITSHEAARVLGVSTDTVRRMADDGRLRAYRPGGPQGHRRFRRFDVESLLAPVDPEPNGGSEAAPPPRSRKGAA